MEEASEAIRVGDVQFSFLMLNWIATLKSSPDKHKPFTSTIIKKIVVF